MNQAAPQTSEGALCKPQFNRLNSGLQLAGPSCQSVRQVSPPCRAGCQFWTVYATFTGSGLLAERAAFWAGAAQVQPVELRRAVDLSACWQFLFAARASRGEAVFRYAIVLSRVWPS